MHMHGLQNVTCVQDRHADMLERRPPREVEPRSSCEFFKMGMRECQIHALLAH